MPARFEDFGSDTEVKDIMDRYINKYGPVFEGFDTGSIHFIRTKTKKPSHNKPLKLHSCRYPQEVFIGKPYIVEVFDTIWSELSTKQKNLAVFHIMCSTPSDAFDRASTNYAGKVKPHYEMYRNEFAACGGVPDWMENPAAMDPMDSDPKQIVVPEEEEEDEEDPIPPVARQPVTMKDIANLDEEAS